MSRRKLIIAGRLALIVALLAILASATLIDRVPPTVQGISLGRTSGDDHVGLTHTTVDVQFSKAVDRASAEQRFRISPAVPGSFSWDGDRTMIFTPEAKLPASSPFVITVAPGYRDLSGNVATSGAGPWQFQTVGQPTLLRSEPADRATDVPVGAAIQLTFDRLMDVGLTQSGITVDPPISFDASWSGPTVTVTPREPLDFGTTYTVTVSGRAADTDGNGLAGPVSLGFTTVAAGLVGAEVVPADGSAGAPVDGPIAVGFDGPVDPASIGGRIRVTPDVGGDVRVVALRPDTPGEAPKANLVVLQPSATLAPHTTYTVELLPGIRAAGDPGRVAPGRTWSFTTAAPSDSLQNQVVFLSDRGGVRNVWAMNPDGSNARQITHELVPVTAYDVSGDGRRIAYAAGGAVRTFRLGDRTPSTLTPDDAFDYAPRLLPDGSAVLVGRRDAATGRDRGIWFLPITRDGSPLQLAATGAPPVGSASGSRDAPPSDGGPEPWASLAAVSSDGAAALLAAGDGRILRSSLADGSSESTGLGRPRGPIRWSDTLRGFVTTATRQSDGATGLWLISGAAPPTRIGDAGAWPDVSVRGGFAWLGGASGQTHLDYAPAAGSPRALAEATDLADLQPSFSPAGDSIVFVRAPSGGGRSQGIWLVGTDGQGLRQLSTDGTDPRWLP